MGEVDIEPLKEIGRNIGRIAGEEVRERVMEGFEGLSGGSREAVARWVKGAMDRLDSLVDEETRTRIMVSCGHGCAAMNSSVIDDVKARRKKYESIDDFLDAEMLNPERGTRLAREGGVLLQYYTPHAYAEGLRCYCSLVSALPADETISLTYCNCAKGFVERFWEGVLERSVRVELVRSRMSGAEECEFNIFL